MIMLCRYMMSGTKKARAETELIMSQGMQRTASLLVSSLHLLPISATDVAAEMYTTAMLQVDEECNSVASQVATQLHSSSTCSIVVIYISAATS